MKRALLLLVIAWTEPALWAALIYATLVHCGYLVTP